eukprot:ANDGO_00770.mRNA.1 hypothetical protein
MMEEDVILFPSRFYFSQAFQDTESDLLQDWHAFQAYRDEMIPTSNGLGSGFGFGHQGLRNVPKPQLLQSFFAVGGDAPAVDSEIVDVEQFLQVVYDSCMSLSARMDSRLYDGPDVFNKFLHSCFCNLSSLDNTNEMNLDILKRAFSVTSRRLGCVACTGTDHAALLAFAEGILLPYSTGNIFEMLFMWELSMCVLGRSMAEAQSVVDRPASVSVVDRCLCLIASSITLSILSRATGKFPLNSEYEHRLFARLLGSFQKVIAMTGRSDVWLFLESAPLTIGDHIVSSEREVVIWYLIWCCRSHLVPDLSLPWKSFISRYLHLSPATCRDHLYRICVLVDSRPPSSIDPVMELINTVLRHGWHSELSVFPPRFQDALRDSHATHSESPVSLIFQMVKIVSGKWATADLRLFNLFLSAVCEGLEASVRRRHDTDTALSPCVLRYYLCLVCILATGAPVNQMPVLIHRVSKSFDISSSNSASTKVFVEFLALMCTIHQRRQISIKGVADILNVVLLSVIGRQSPSDVRASAYDEDLVRYVFSCLAYMIKKSPDMGSCEEYTFIQDAVLFVLKHPQKFPVSISRSVIKILRSIISSPASVPAQDHKKCSWWLHAVHQHLINIITSTSIALGDDHEQDLTPLFEMVDLCSYACIQMVHSGVSNWQTIVSIFSKLKWLKSVRFASRQVLFRFYFRVCHVQHPLVLLHSFAFWVFSLCEYKITFQHSFTERMLETETLSGLARSLDVGAQGLSDRRHFGKLRLRLLEMLLANEFVFAEAQCPFRLVIQPCLAALLWYLSLSPSSVPIEGVACGPFTFDVLSLFLKSKPRLFYDTRDSQNTLLSWILDHFFNFVKVLPLAKVSLRLSHFPSLFLLFCSLGMWDFKDPYLLRQFVNSFCRNLFENILWNASENDELRFHVLSSSLSQAPSPFAWSFGSSILSYYLLRCNEFPIHVRKTAFKTVNYLLVQASSSAPHGCLEDLYLALISAVVRLPLNSSETLWVLHDGVRSIAECFEKLKECTLCHSSNVATLSQYLSVIVLKFTVSVLELLLPAPSAGQRDGPSIRGLFSTLSCNQPNPREADVLRLVSSFAERDRFRSLSSVFGSKVHSTNSIPVHPSLPLQQYRSLLSSLFTLASMLLPLSTDAVRADWEHIWIMLRKRKLNPNREGVKGVLCLLRDANDPASLELARLGMDRSADDNSTAALLSVSFCRL